MAVCSINVYPTSVTIQKGTWFYGAYAIVNTDGSTPPPVEWSSVNPSIASVGAASGYIYGASEGVTAIRARVAGTDCYNFIAVTVVDNVPVTSVTLNYSNLSIKKGLTKTLCATVCPKDATNKAVTWKSSNSSVATVSNGIVTAVAKGTTTITATAADRNVESDSCLVTVTEDVLVSDICVYSDLTELVVGKSIYCHGIPSPSNATNSKLKWTSIYPDIATVNENSGLVLAQKAGTAKIRAIATDGSGVYAECTITVKDPDPIAVTKIEIYPSHLTMDVGEEKDLCATISPCDATNKSVVWNTCDCNIADVDTNGVVTAKSTGITCISALARDGSGVCAQCMVKVNPLIAVTGVSVSPSSLTMSVGDTENLSAVITPSNATEQSVIWHSDDSNIADVDTNGVVTAKSVGTTTITATTVDGGFAASCEVTVSYCGGSNYKNVAEHTMALQNDGYYVCSTCGYRVKSPALQDKDVLNESDYLTILSLLHEYVALFQQHPIYAEKMLAMIDAIRGLPENKTKYEYCDENGIYVPEYKKNFGNTQMYIHVNKGSCVTEWVLLRTMYSIIGAVTPFPYSIIISAISDRVAQDHPGVKQMTGAEIVKTFLSYLAEGVLSIPNSSIELIAKVKNAADIYFTFDNVTSDISCTNDCYNIDIVTINKEESCDCHQIKYHYSNGSDTMGRYSEYNVNGITTVYPSANYYDHVNNREYDVYV